MQIEQLGPYKIGRKIGRGGMGAVYEAVHNKTGERAAIKLLSVSLSHEEGFRERFKAEIETLRKLNHPNIVRLFGFGEQDELLYYAMELVDGRSLEEELHAGRRFDWHEVTDYAVQTCRALKHAHDRGVIHRDLKPANLMLTPDGRIKLSDFGIAKLFGSSSLTADGGVLGTAEYMSPEQADGRPVSHRSDLYSLGGVMYTLLAHRPPFMARSLVEMLQLQRFAEPDPVRRYSSDTPEELERIVMQLLDKDPERRIPTAMVLARRLEAMRHGLSSRGGDSAISTTRSAADEQEFVVSNPTMAAPKRTASPTDGDTRTAPPAGPADKTMAAESSLASNVTLDDASVAPREGQEVDDEADADDDRAPAPTHRFTHIDEEERRRADAAFEETTPWISLHTWALLAGVVLLAAGTWYVLQPASSDRLYDRIAAAAKDSDVDALVGVEHDINDFLAHYPNDPRRKEVEQRQRQVELYWAEKNLELRSRQLAKADDLSPVERAYLEAVNYARISPELGVAKLQAFLDLYGDNGSLTKRAQQSVDLARRQLERLKKEVAEYADRDLARINEELDRADALADDDVEAANRVRRAVVELYADKPWAAQSVERARRALDEPQSAD